MSRKRTLNAIMPALVAGSLFCTAATPPALAGTDDNKPNTTMEQRSDQVQSAIKDAWLDGKLETALLLNEHLNSFKIDTDVKNRVASLKGTVESDIDRDLAGEIAASIEGISDVRNELVVDKSKTRADNDRSDTAMPGHGFKQSVANATMTARIKSKLLVNNNTAGLSIDVDSQHGQVTLSGEVDSEQEKELAERIAANVSGVDAVYNKLTVKSDS